MLMENARSALCTAQPVSIKNYVLNAKLAIIWMFRISSMIQFHANNVLKLCLTAKYARMKIFVTNVLQITSS